MASSRTVASTAPTSNPHSDSEFLEDSSSSDMSRRTISELSKVPRVGHMDGTEDIMTEERMRVVMQEQLERKKQLTLTAMNKAFVRSINAYSLVLVLLATVTYAGFLQPPGSFDGDGFMRTYENSSLTWFVYFNSLSFYFSMADLILCLSGNFAPLADLHAETFLSNPKPKKLTKRSSVRSFRIRFLNDFVDRITQGLDAPCPSIDKVADHDRVPDSVYLEQAITHRLAHFVAYTLTKAATINLLFVISLTCCVAAFAAAGSAVTSRPQQSQVPVIVTSAIGCFTYLCFMLWLLTDSIKFFWRAGFSLGAVATSLADALAQNAGHLETQLQYCGGNMDNATAVPEAAAADHPVLAPMLDSRGTFVRRVGTRDRSWSPSN